MIQIDTLKLELPLSKCRVNDRSFSPSRKVVGRLCSVPPSGFGQVYIDTHRKTVVIEMSAKMLGDAYYESINLSNFTHVRERVSELVSFTNETLHNEAKVLRCDVVNNIDVTDYGCTKRELINILGLLKSHTDYTLDIYDKTNNNGLALRAMYTTVRDRTILYDKQLDLAKSGNVKFIKSLNNPKQVLQSFENVVRIESNISSAKRLKSKLNIPNIYLGTVLSSCETVNYNNILKICNRKPTIKTDMTDYLYSQNIGNFTKHDIRAYSSLFIECNYDIALVQQTLSIENQWNKKDKYYYWTKKGVRDLFLAAKLKNETGLVSEKYEIFTKFLSDLSKVA